MLKLQKLRIIKYGTYDVDVVGETVLTGYDDFKKVWQIWYWHCEKARTLDLENNDSDTNILKIRVSLFLSCT